VQKFCLENATVSFGNTENQFNSRNRIKVGSSKKTIAISRDHQEQKLDIATAREMIPETTRARIDALTLRMGYVKEVL
jgi:tRNA nucleotidyltransferase/poly(A) polymerase